MHAGLHMAEEGTPPVVPSGQRNIVVPPALDTIGARPTGDEMGDFDVRDFADGLEGSVLFRLIAHPQLGRRIAYVSANVERLFGVSAATVRGDVDVWYDLIAPRDRARVAEEALAAQAEQNGLAVEAAFDLSRGRRVFNVTATPRPLDGGWTAWDGVATDVTHLRAGREERQRLTQIVSATADIVGTIDVDGHLAYLNDAGRRLLALPALGERLQIGMVHPARLLTKYVEEILPQAAREGVWSGESFIVDREGCEVPVSQVIVAHRGADGRLTHLSTVIRDLSDRAGMERELRRLNMRSETLLREVSHRVKNLFALVPAIVQLSARGTDDMGELVDKVRARVTALARSHALTMDVSGTGGMALEALVRAVLEPYEDRVDQFDIDGPALEIATQDGNGLGLMLHELATNAAKHGALAHRAGRVSIAWAVMPPRAHGDENGDDRSRLLLTWREAMPDFEPSEEATGFGTKLFDRLLGAQGGHVERSWSEDGLAITLDLPFFGGEVAG